MLGASEREGLELAEIEGGPDDQAYGAGQQDLKPVPPQEMDHRQGLRFRFRRRLGSLRAAYQ